MLSFNELDLPKTLSKSLETMGFETLTPIQEQTIPVSLQGKDVLGTAQTGTGKTGAFAIPLAAKLLENEDETVLVMAPTRELAKQVITVFHQLLAKERSIRTALLIGGDSILKQFKQLKSNPRVIVGTPGRINDHLKRGTLKFGEHCSLVLDETDLMLDMGFDVQIETIIAEMPKERQTLMFSATLPKKIEKLAGKYLRSPVRVSVGQESTPAKDIQQDILKTSGKEKFTHLLRELSNREGSVIIFVKTKRGADELAVKLSSADHTACAIHGDLQQRKRERILKSFRNERYRIMVATDVAARGIDIPHIRHVINYDLPQSPEDYVHRIGRTARAGETGAALSFVTKSEQGKWYAIERLLNPDLKRPAPKRERSNSSKRKPRFGGGGSFKKGKRTQRKSA